MREKISAQFGIILVGSANLQEISNEGGGSDSVGNVVLLQAKEVCRVTKGL